MVSLRLSWQLCSCFNRACALSQEVSASASARRVSPSAAQIFELVLYLLRSGSSEDMGLATCPNAFTVRLASVRKS